MDTGSRRELDSVVGFTAGRPRCTARSQSKKSEASWRVQKRRSSFSSANAGIGFLRLGARLFIDPPFAPTHVSRRDDPDQSATNGEDQREPPAAIGSAQSRVPRLRSRMARIRCDQNRTVEETFLGFAPRDPTELPIPLRIAFVPFKTYALGQVVRKPRHPSRILPKYTLRANPVGCLVGAP